MYFMIRKDYFYINYVPVELELIFPIIIYDLYHEAFKKHFFNTICQDHYKIEIQLLKLYVKGYEYLIDFNFALFFESLFFYL